MSRAVMPSAKHADGRRSAPWRPRGAHPHRPRQRSHRPPRPDLQARHGLAALGRGPGSPDRQAPTRIRPCLPGPSPPGAASRSPPPRSLASCSPAHATCSPTPASPASPASPAQPTAHRHPYPPGKERHAPALAKHMRPVACRAARDPRRGRGGRDLPGIRRWSAGSRTGTCARWAGLMASRSWPSWLGGGEEFEESRPACRRSAACSATTVSSSVTRAASSAFRAASSSYEGCSGCGTPEPNHDHKPGTSTNTPQISRDRDWLPPNTCTTISCDCCCGALLYLTRY